MTEEFRPPAFDKSEDVFGYTPPDGVRALRDIEYARVVGYRPLRLDLYVPKATGRVPVVAYIHGGAFMMGSRRGGHTDWVSGPIWDALLDDGIAVATIEYRLSSEALFPACLHDVKAAVRWLRCFGPDFGLNPDQIIAWGESAGAYLSAFVGLNNDDDALNGDEGITDEPSDVLAAIAWYPPTDFATMDSQARPDALQIHGPAGSPESMLLGTPLADAPEAVRYASPVNHVTDRSAPMLLMHGNRDRLVPFQQSIELHDALTAAGRPVELEIVEGADHAFMGVDRTPIIERSIDFIHKQVDAN